MRAGEIARAIADIEALGPKVAWSVGSITNDCHAVHPYGEGIHVMVGLTLGSCGDTLDTTDTLDFCGCQVAEAPVSAPTLPRPAHQSPHLDC
jgi:hypothetical protein